MLLQYQIMVGLFTDSIITFDSKLQQRAVVHALCSNIYAQNNRNVTKCFASNLGIWPEYYNKTLDMIVQNMLELCGF
jgi:hypothetical protein